MIIGRIDNHLIILFGGFMGNTFRTLSDLNDHNITVSTSNLIAKMQHDTSWACASFTTSFLTQRNCSPPIKRIYNVVY